MRKKDKLRDFDQNKYTRTYREKHPEKVRQWQLNSYANALRRAGWICTPPDTL